MVWWSALQSSKYGRIIVMTDKGTATLALGNNPRTSGTYNVDVIEQPAGLRFVVARPADAMNSAIRKVMFFGASGGARPLELSLPMARGGWLALDDLSPDEARRGYRSGVSGHCGSVERQPV